MRYASPIHVVCRSDGRWQIERECALVPLSIHDKRDPAIDAACVVARRERRGLAIHRMPRPRARLIDVAAWALLHGQASLHDPSSDELRRSTTTRPRRAG